MNISNYLNSEDCIMELKASNKEEAIREISENLFKKGKILDLEGFIKDVLERERLGSTGIGHSIALPHARTQTVNGFIIGFGKSTKGIDFNSIDG
ncbi:MAG: PTS sugar transporter subunit IIA, partial [Candidatus Omnitrophica bacterium]|nr:PTS sugar transporter subunit IIA [Candidatus Omnitrophota bacterium]